MRSADDFVRFVHRDPQAEVLVVSNTWPEPDRPVYGIFVQRQIESLQRAGVRFDVLYPRGYAHGAAYAIAGAKLALSTIGWRGRYRLVHAHGAEAAFAARCHVGTPMIVSYLGDDVLGDRDEHGNLTRDARVRAPIVRAHSQLFDAVISKSRAVYDALPPRAQRRSVVIPNGVDRTLFRPVDRAEARSSLGWGDEAVALFAATKPGSPGKRRWLAQAACDAAGVRLVVSADTAPREMPVLMGAADCLLVTSAVEGSPNVVKEALQCNLPVVATAVGDIPERLEGVTPSWICPPDVQLFAAALRECIAIGRRSDGRDVTADLDENRVAERILDLYQHVARLTAGATRSATVADRR
ncbi:MAG: teichuronic acid biosynthesis glycosyltransferase TuaC [Gaiellaceae bacterium]|nr:teichuronic acid biosynthesis glycosyltransferase TuaC [Gaiellaceae bacterium]